MRYMMLYKPGREHAGPPSQEEMARMGALIEEMTRAGVLISTGGLQHSSTGTRVRISGSSFAVTDGPFTETKELIAGFAIVEASSKEHALQLAKRFLTVTGEGVTEIRPMHMAPDLAPAW